MKLLFVHCGGDYGCDYSALNFQNKHAGTNVSDIIADPDKFKPDETADDFDEYEGWDMSIHEVGDVSPEFLEFFRRHVQDYDDSKHQNFWMENEVIPN